MHENAAVHDLLKTSSPLPGEIRLLEIMRTAMRAIRPEAAASGVPGLGKAGGDRDDSGVPFKGSSVGAGRKAVPCARRISVPAHPKKETGGPRLSAPENRTPGTPYALAWAGAAPVRGSL